MEDTLAHVKQQRQLIANSRLNLTGIATQWMSHYDPVDAKWTKLTVKKREALLPDTLVRACLRYGTTFEDLWSNCPDVRKKELCAGDGSNFLKIVNHFILAYTVLPHLDFPILRDERV